MVQRVGGFRRKTRHKLSKHFRTRGKLSIRRALHVYPDGARVTLSADPAYQRGMYHPRFHGKTGIVQKQQGSCFLVRITDGNKAKDLLIHPTHLKAA